MKVSETWDLFGINTQQRLGQMGCFVWTDTRKLLPASKSATRLITSEQNISPALIPQSVQKKTEGSLIRGGCSGRTKQGQVRSFSDPVWTFPFAQLRSNQAQKELIKKHHDPGRCVVMSRWETAAEEGKERRKRRKRSEGLPRSSAACLISPQCEPAAPLIYF